MLKMQIIGYIGQDATVNEVRENLAIKFSVAHTYKEKTVWVECTLFRKPENATLAQYLKKGTQVYVDGTPSVYAYASQSGEICGKLQLTANEVQLLGTKNTNTGTQMKIQPQTTEHQQELPNDDLPF